MCEHCRKFWIRWEPITDDLEQEFGGALPCLHESDDEPDDDCDNPAVYEWYDMMIEGHVCEEHKKIYVEHIGDDIENFLPIEEPQGDTCDRRHSDDTVCNHEPKYARVAGGASFFCLDHATMMGLPHDPGLRRDLANQPKN